MVHPPRPRDHSTGLPKKVRAYPSRPRIPFYFPFPLFALPPRRLGLKVALSTKLAQGRLQVVDSLQLSSHKTKQLAQNTTLPKEWGSVLLVENEAVNPNLEKAAASIL